MRALTARAATAWCFFVSGVTLSSWFVRMPDVRDALALTNRDVGLASFVVAGAAILAMHPAGRFAAREGTAPLLRVSVVALPLLPLAATVAPGGSGFWVLLTVFGLTVGALDVAMNGHAVTVERVLERPVLSGFHAAWSAGAIAGAAGAGAAAGAGLSPRAHFAVVGVFLVVASVVAIDGLLPATVDRSAPSARRVRARWRAGLVRLGVLGGACALAEGAALTWSAVFMTDERSASSAVAALAYLSLAVAMAAGRLAGDRLRTRWSTGGLLRAGAWCSAAALATALLVPSAAATALAFGVCGLGLSVLLPVLIGAVGEQFGRRDGAVGPAIARFTTVSYAGVLSGPVVIGAITEAYGLTVALVLPVLLLAVVGIDAPRAVTPIPANQQRQAE
ncbi:MFS transporter [Micromonospora sp. NPDC049645]|uniref:MFS transporter n=1 Tax=Micromonospora sp. NPDC049645 TaxID=3155508 RepID=UPI00343CB517